MKKILILGSSGYIGSYLSYKFKKKYNVITHSRKKIEDKSFNKNIFKRITGDIRKLKTIEKIVNLKPNYIIFTISLNHFESEKNLKLSMKNNYYSLDNLIKNIIKKKLKTKIIYFSTMQVYGRNFSKSIINESYPKKINNIYSMTHSMCEDLLLKNNNKVKSYSLRLSNSFGMPILKKINCWWLVMNDFCRSAVKNNEILIKSDGSALRDFISLKDISRIVDKLLRKDFSYPIINVCSGKTYSIKEIANRISKSSYFKKKITVKIMKKNNKKKIRKFKYDTKLIKILGISSLTNIDLQIRQFLYKINNNSDK